MYFQPEVNTKVREERDIAAYLYHNHNCPLWGEEDRGSHLFESKWGFGPGWGGSKYIYLEFMGLHLLICYIEENKLQKLEFAFSDHPE